MVNRAGKLRSFTITFRSWFATFYYSVKALVVMPFSRKRAVADKIIHQWSQRLIDLIKLDIRVKGQFPDTQGKPVIVMCSHSSAYDIPVSILSIPGSVRMLAKKELFKVPLFGRAMRLCEFLSIDRQNKEQARKDLIRAREKMLDGIIIWIAPEGTRSPDGNLLPFKKGGVHLALETGALIVPVVIKDIHKVLPAKSLTFNLNYPVEVRFGDPIDATQYSLEQRNELTRLLRDRMQQLLIPEIQN